MAFAFGLSAEIERQLISQRTQMALDNVRAKGTKLGRPFGAQSKKLKLAKNQKRVKTMLNQGRSKSEISNVLGVSRSTLRRFISRSGYQTSKFPVPI